jgi:hypothetical protein
MVDGFDWKLDWKIVFAALGWMTSIILFLIKLRSDRKQPQKIVCREIAQTSLVKIKKEALDHIEITFDGEPVDRLGYLEVDLFNSGNEIIKAASIRFEFPSGTRVLSQSAKVEPKQSQDYRIGFTSTEKYVLDMVIPYLNPRKHHKQHVLVAFVCDGDVSDLRVSGGSEGWSIEYQVPMQRRMLDRNRRDLSFAISMISLIVMMAAFSIGVYIFGRDSKFIDVIQTPAGIIIYATVILSAIIAFISPLNVISNLSRRKSWYDHGEDYYGRSLRVLRAVKARGKPTSIEVAPPRDDHQETSSIAVAPTQKDHQEVPKAASPRPRRVR